MHPDGTIPLYISDKKKYRQQDTQKITLGAAGHLRKLAYNPWEIAFNEGKNRQGWNEGGYYPFTQLPAVRLATKEFDKRQQKKANATGRSITEQLRDKRPHDFFDDELNPRELPDNLEGLPYRSTSFWAHSMSAPENREKIKGRQREMKEKSEQQKENKEARREKEEERNLAQSELGKGYLKDLEDGKLHPLTRKRKGLTSKVCDALVYHVMNQKPNQYFAKASTVEAKRLKLQEEPRLRESFKRGKEKFENANRAT